MPIQDFSEIPAIPDKAILKQFFDKDGNPTGHISIDTGADGAWLQFDCDCLDALPFCKAQCCALIGTVVHPDEQEKYDYVAYWDERLQALVLRREADGFCSYLDRPTRRCGIYEERPRTCQVFHCTRGAEVRGWKLANRVERHSTF